jgi:heme/copper-type cytochrome/quinol oxidase subunit 2
MSRMLRPHAPAVLLVSVLALTGCGSDEPTATPTTTPTTQATTTTPSPAASSSQATEPEPVVTPDDAQIVAITVAGGEITGDTGRVEVPTGTTVRLTVTSDAPDEIHVHGFDLRAALSPGQATQLEFVADRPGIFEVELHDARRVLTRLQIS